SRSMRAASCSSICFEIKQSGDVAVQTGAPARAETDKKGSSKDAAATVADVAAPDWPLQLYRALKAARVSQVSYVPDAGPAQLIKLFEADAEVHSNVLTTEEEGIAIAAGAWLGGLRSVLLLQSSGVGNCINMLALATVSRFPL